jgi:hypothetical protein
MVGVRVLILALLALVGEVRAERCKGLEPCTACVNCSACWNCSPKNPGRSSCGVLRNQADARYRESRRKHWEEVSEVRWAWSLIERTQGR